MGFTRAILDVLLFYAWFHVSVIVETKTSSPYYKDAARALLENVKVSTEPFELQFYTVGEPTDETMGQVLRMVKQRSRGKLTVMNSFLHPYKTLLVAE